MSRRRSESRTGGWVAAVRLGACTALAGPLLWFAALHFARGGTLDTLLTALVDGALAGLLDALAYALREPARCALYLAVLWLAGRLAFGRPARHRRHERRRRAARRRRVR